MLTYQSTVEGMVKADQPFGEIEEYIDGLAIPDDAKAALWLLAWSYQARSTQRRVAKEALAFIAG